MPFRDPHLPDAFPAEATARGSVAVAHAANLWTAPHLLLQKFQAPEFTAEAVMDGRGLRPGERAGLVFGEDYAWIGLERRGDRHRLVVRSVEKAPDAQAETELINEPWDSPRATLRAIVMSGARFSFAVVDGRNVRKLGPTFQAKPGRWVGAKVGLFAAAPPSAQSTGTVSFARFTVGGLD